MDIGKTEFGLFWEYFNLIPKAVSVLSGSESEPDDPVSKLSKMQRQANRAGLKKGPRNVLREKE